MLTGLFTLLGAVIGFIGSYFAVRQNRLEREREAYGPIVRKLSQIQLCAADPVVVTTHDTLFDIRCRELASDVEALVFPLRRVDRDDIHPCLAAIADPYPHGPNSRLTIRRASTAIHAIILARANKSRQTKPANRPAWLRNVLEEFRQVEDQELESLRLDEEG